MGNGKYDEIGSTTASSRWFYIMVGCSQIAGIMAIVMISFYFAHFRGGFNWGSDLNTIFNNHPLLMTLGMIFFYGDAILAYRVLTDVKKIYVKIIHACLLALSLILSSVGLKAVFDSHNRANPPKDNLNSLHSWVGLTVVILFGLQWVCGFMAFLFPKLSESIRKIYMPSHKFWGKTIFILAVNAVVMGVTEYSLFYSLYDDKNRKTERDVLNIFAIFVLVFAIIILYLVSNPGFQRPSENDIEYVPLTE